MPLTKPVHGTAASRTLEECGDAARSFLTNRMEKFFATAKEELFTGARDAPSNMDQADFFDSMQEIEQIHAPLEQAFLGIVTDTLAHLGRPEPHQPESSQEDELSLSLVDTRALSDMLAVQKIIEKAGPRFDDTVFSISTFI